MTQIITCQRERFSIPDHITYFNCAYLSPLLREAEAAAVTGARREASPWTIFPRDFFEDTDRVRSLFAQLIGVAKDSVAILPSVSYGIGVAAKNVRVAQGRRIILLDSQFPSNVYPWLDLAKRKRLEVVRVPCPSEMDWTEAVLMEIDERTGVVALPHCHWTDGRLVDLIRVGERCASLDVPLVIDATQSLGAMPLDITRVKPAFVVASAYKWLLGPYGLALMYVSPDYQLGEPLEFNWANREGSQQFSNLANYTDRILKSAERYDVGERSSFTLIPILIAALEQLLDWGVNSIYRTLSTYNDELAGALSELGFRTIAKQYRAGHLLGLRFPGELPRDLRERLVRANIFVSIRGDSIRIAPHLYNDARDRTRLVETLRSVL